MFDVAVTYIFRDNHGQLEVLLGEKLTGIGVGKIVAPGGKCEPQEDPAEAAVREIREEVGLLVQTHHLTHIATIRYPFVERPELSQRSFAYMVRDFAGDPSPSRELDARWWPVEGIPFDQMWADASLWLPDALAGNFIEGTISIGPDNQVAEAVFHSEKP